MQLSNKNILRVKYLNIRNEISSKNEKSAIICGKILNNEIYKKSKIVALYKNLPSEVDTTKLIEESIKMGKTVVIPRVMDSNMLNFYKIQISEDFDISELGIEEPYPLSEKLVSKDKIDLIVVPAVCFDLNRNRLGFGKGCYDSCLQNSSFYKIGVCFDKQIAEIDLNNEEFDIKMDIVITEKREIK